MVYLPKIPKEGLRMKKIAILLLICFMSCLSFGCAEESKPVAYKPLTEEEVRTAIENMLAPQIQAYNEAFGIDDLSVDIQFKECKINEPLRSDGEIYYDGWVSYYIRDIIHSPTLLTPLTTGEFTDEMLKQLSAIQFEYPTFYYEDYEIFGMSAMACPTFADENGQEYTVTEGIMLKGDIIAYISPDAHLEFDAKVGDNIYHVIPHGNTSSSSPNSSSTTKCPSCNGSGYVKFYYGSSDLEAYLDGYDPYTVGKCPMCKGTGH